MRTTYNGPNRYFTFGITDIARLLGKSPVTLRAWERNGFVSFPRDGRGDRRLSSQGIREIATKARDGGRIDSDRYHLIMAAMTLLETIERENI